MLGTAAAILVLAGGIAYAAIAGEDGTITACYKANGILRVIDAEAGQTCTGSEQQLTWNQTGPQGPQGPPGPQGPQGPSGALGDLFQSQRSATVDNYAGQDIVLEMGSLPAGSYSLDLAVAASAGAGPSSLPNRDLYCVFGTTQTNLAAAQMTFPSLPVNGNGFTVLPLLAFFTVTESTPFVLRCSIFPSNDSPHIVINATLHATEVGSITGF